MARTEPTPRRRHEPIDATSVHVALGRRIAELRRARGMTQAEFAEKMDWSLQYVSRVESGREHFRLTRLIEIANLLEVDLVALLRPPKSLEVRRGRPPKAKTPSKTLPKSPVRDSRPAKARPTKSK